MVIFMLNMEELEKRFAACGREHKISLKNIHSGRGLKKETGRLLHADGFVTDILLVSDKNCLRAVDGISDILKAEGFSVTEQIYEDLRIATMDEVKRIIALSENLHGILSVGTGSLNDICRLAAAKGGKQLAIFATAPSMDGFASNCAPIVTGCFKETLPAKQPDVIIADSEILASAPVHLKAAGFGDMLGKYIGLADWRVSNLVTGEYYCERVAQLTRDAVNRIVRLCDRITDDDPDAAAEVFEALVLTGVAMQLAGCSRPASGTEHILSHFWGCKKLENGEVPDFHGKKVGVATLIIAGIYEKMAQHEEVFPKMESVDWEAVRGAYGEKLWPDVKRLNMPTVTEGIAPDELKRKWPQIREIVRQEIPTSEVLLDVMHRAGAAVDAAQIDISPELCEQGIEYHTYMRHRISLIRLRDMLKI